MKLTIISALMISFLSVAKCDACEPGYFWSANIGCNKCFCSGVTDKCHAGSFYSQEVGTDVREIKGFLDWPNTLAEPLRYARGAWGLGYFFKESDDNKVFVWELPFKFNKNRARNYGCWLHVDQDIELTNGAFVPWTPIVIRILSSEVNISITASPHATSGNTNSYQPRISEKNAYIGEDRSQPATKADVMRALLSADKILVVSDHPNKKFIAIRNVWQQAAVDEVTSSTLDRPDSIEVCDCPQGYSGDSCESCTGRLCKPCKNPEPCEEQCNDKGICLGCPQCLECTSPYHRNINNKTASVFGACESGDPK